MGMHLIFPTILFLCGSLIQESSSSYNNYNYRQNVNSTTNSTYNLPGTINVGIELVLVPVPQIKVKVHDNYSPHRTVSDYIYRLPPKTHTEYKVKTVQTGVAFIPPGSEVPVRIVPDHNQTKTYLQKTDTTIHYVPHMRDRKPHTRKTPSRSRKHSRHSRKGDCIKCPSENIIVAKKAYDAVLIHPPKLLSCHNRVVFNTAYQIETLYGSEFKFLLPHGSHSFIGKIRNKFSKNFEQSCILRYKVIVRQCRRFYPMDRNLRMKCDLGNIWGSKCYFVCRQGYLSHNEPIVCGENQQWEGDEPECLPEPVTNPNHSCDLPLMPSENGRYSCQYPESENDDSENDLASPNGSICRVKCDSNYEIPKHLEQFSVIRCENGRWNSTILDLCQPTWNF